MVHDSTDFLVLTGTFPKLLTQDTLVIESFDDPKVRHMDQPTVLLTTSISLT